MHKGIKPLRSLLKRRVGENNTVSTHREQLQLKGCDIMEAAVSITNFIKIRCHFALT